MAEDDSTSSDIINVEMFGNYWKSSLDCTDYFTKSTSADEETDRLSTLMGLPRNAVAELESVCSEKTLQLPEYTEHDGCRILSTIQPCDLKTVKFQEAELRKRQSASYRAERQKQMRNRQRDLLLVKPQLQEVPESFQIQPGEVLIQLVVFRPLKGVVRCRNKFKPDHTFKVIGNQTLADLRDEIRCPSDLVVPGDFSATPNLATELCAKDLYKSAFFFINHEFYNDRRTDDTIDYSEPIRKWAEQKGLPKFTCRAMESTKFKDLEFQLGVPYLYMHQGNCEHILVFKDISMIHPQDDLDTRNYPLMVGRITRCRTMCQVCYKNSARWLTLNDELAPESPCFFCDHCFKALHYNSKMEKMCNFEAYKYFHGHVVT